MATKKYAEQDGKWRKDELLPVPSDEQERAIKKAFEDVIALAKRASAHEEKPAGAPTNWRHRRPESRVVSIFGARGTGKTTALEHVLLLLQNKLPTQAEASSSQRRNNKWWPSDLDIKTTDGKRFLVLPIIDATVGDDEDSLRYQLSFALERALERSGAAADKQLPAARAIEDLVHDMSGQDSAWRAATARLSADMTDFGILTRRRVKAVVNFGACFGEALAAVLKATGNEVAVLAFDDLDLSPQQYADVVGVLGDLRWSDNLVVIVAGYVDEITWRVRHMLAGSSTFRADVHAGAVDVTDPDDRERIRKMATRIVAKLCPVEYRASLPVLSAGARLIFPRRQGTPFASDRERYDPDCVAGLLAWLGVAHQDHVRGPGKPFQPGWGWALPDNLRGVDAAHRLLLQVAERAQQYLDDEEARATRAKRGDPEYQREKKPGDDWPSRPGEAFHLPIHFAIAALAEIAEAAELRQWAHELRGVLHEGFKRVDDDEYAVLWNHFDLEACGIAELKENVSLPTFQRLQRSLASGTELEQWFVRTDTGALAGEQGVLASPSVVAPCAVDICLRRLPSTRVNFASSWWFTKAVLDQHSVKGSLSGGFVVPKSLTAVLRRAQDAMGPDKRMPLFRSLPELLSLCRALYDEPYPVITAVEVSDARAAEGAMAQLQRVQLFVPGADLSPTGFCDFMAFLCGIWRLRRAFVRAWTAQHWGVMPGPEFESAPVREGAIGIELADLLDRLLSSAVAEVVVGGADAFQSKLSGGDDQAEVDSRWGELTSELSFQWLSRDLWRSIRAALTPSADAAP